MRLTGKICVKVTTNQCLRELANGIQLPAFRETSWARATSTVRRSKVHSFFTEKSFQIRMSDALSTEGGECEKECNVGEEIN